MLELQNIQKSFGGVHAIQGSTFQVNEKSCTALIGPNGAGKTTLFDIITGLITPDTGTITFKGEDISNKKPHTRSNLGMSRTFQQVRIFQYLTIYDHLEMAEDNLDTKVCSTIFSKKKDRTDEYMDYIRHIGIDRHVDTPAGDLSYGQRKLLEIAVALKKQHDILLLDEPVAGVNSVVQDRIENLLLDLKKQGETILLIDHDMSFIRKLSDHVVVLDAGIVLTEGKPDMVLKDKKVLEAYLGE